MIHFTALHILCHLLGKILQLLLTAFIWFSNSSDSGLGSVPAQRSHQQCRMLMLKRQPGEVRMVPAAIGTWLQEAWVIPKVLLPFSIVQWR